MLRILLATAAIVVTASAAHAQNADFTLTNSTGYPLREVYVSPSKQSEWGEDRLGKHVLADGQNWHFTFPQSKSQCMQDLKVVYDDDGTSSTWENINLCEIDKIRLKYNRQTDVTTATFD